MDENRIKNIMQELGSTKLVVASKYVDSNSISLLYNLGINNFGENRVDAFLTKYDELKDYHIIWHFIGHLQTNKAKEVINKIDCLHSLDSLKLANIIEKERVTPLDCFIEVHMTNSETKDGVLPENLETFLNSLKEFKKVHVIGLMTMTDKTQSDTEKLQVFKRVKDLANKYNLKETSMGMTDDYKLALEAGTTCVRLGRIICL